MKKAFLLVSALVMTFAPFDKESLSKKERKYAVKYLESSMEDLFKTVKNLTPDQWNFKPADGGWSVAEVAEHLMIAEKGFHGLVSKTIVSNPDFKKAPASQDLKTDKEVIEFIRDRSPEKRVKTSPAAEPKGESMTPSEFTEKYKSDRKVFINYVATTDDELKGYYFKSPAGHISAYQWIILASAHTQRHMAQMREVMESTTFPE